MENERHVKYTPGSSVRILSRARLEELSRNSKYHFKVDGNQFAFAGQVAMVKWSGLYHGGGFVYQLDGVPGYWHEQLLEPVLRLPK
jgi:hypothetical protein